VVAFYHSDYFLPLPTGHPFPMSKFREAREILKRELFPLRVEESPVASWEDLALVHTSEYLEAIERGTLDSRALRVLGLPWSEAIFRRSALEVGGTIAAVAAALESGLAFNLAGGTHHAFPDKGCGYCVFNDVAVAVRSWQRKERDLKVWILDTDAHQGNGTHAIFRDEPHVRTYSIHVGKNYPSQKEAGTMDVPLERWVSGAEYLSALAETLECFGRGTVDLIIWIAGADLHAEDRFGQMRLSWEDLRKRDAWMAQWLRSWSVPVVVLYGGGYHAVEGMTARIHAETVKTVFHEFGG
jgi:acetoin utilization deacetylase AcuC-like enzyme